MLAKSKIPTTGFVTALIEIANQLRCQYVARRIGSPDQTFADPGEESCSSSGFGTLERFRLDRARQAQYRLATSDPTGTYSETFESTRDTRHERCSSSGDTIQRMFWLVAVLTHPALVLVLLIECRCREACLAEDLSLVRTDSCVHREANRSLPFPILPETFASESLKPNTVFLARLPAPRAIPMPTPSLPLSMMLS